MFVADLKNSVRKTDIRNHFSGCTKVTVKQNRATLHHKYDTDAVVTDQYLLFRYAFVLHRTNREAQRNLQRPINYRLLGPECRIEYANGRSNDPNNHQSSDNKRLLVKQIPENVSQHELRRVFVGSHAIHYYPARVIRRPDTMTPVKCETKILSGYD